MIEPKQMPLSLYLHIPWCIRKCPYCDFNSHTLKSNLPEEDYFKSLMNDLKHDLKYVYGRPLQSIFIGGGTPSLMQPKSFTTLLNYIEKLMPFDSEIEITMEANPGTVEQSRFVGFKKAGINRLSLGIQSFQDEKLKVLGRIHDGDTAKKAIDAAVNAGFDNFNLDLMFGLPSQTIEQACADLKQAIAMQPPHLSWYQLTLEPNTLFHRYPPQALPNDDQLWQMQLAGQRLLSQAGFQQYEVSAYAKEHAQCRHNRNYWQFGDYLGIGAGAHSKLFDEENKKIIRLLKFKNPRDYLNQSQSYIADKNEINSTQLPFEFMLNTLRLYQPITFELLQQRTGLTRQAIQQPLEQAQANKMVTVDDNEFVVTDFGRRFLNDLTALFLT